MGAMAVMGYQTIISRMLDQSKPAVLTVGAFQAGVNNNIIPVSATLKLNLRWYDEKVRERMIAGIKAVTRGVLVMNDMPPDYQAQYTMKGYATPVFNGKEQTEVAQAALVQQLGADKVLPGVPPLMGSEDFHMLASPYPDTKVLFLEVGSGKPDVYKNMVEKKQLPAAMNHTPGFVVELPAIATGARAVTATLTAFFNQPR
ncbi:N-acyl-L-amino acid amidohydrolase [compost metagenome]